MENFEKSTDVVSNPQYNERGLNDILRDFTKDGGKVYAGTYATVLVHPKWKFVLKIFSNDVPYLSFVRFVLKNPRPSFPAFYDKPRRIIPNFKRDRNASYLYVIKTELLNHITDNEWENINYYLKYSNTDFSRLPDNYVWQSVKDSVNNIEHDYPSIKIFNKDYDFLINESGLKFSLDIHQQNIMKRNNGEFVLTDPFWEGETPYQTYDRLMRAEIDDYPEHSEDNSIKGGQLYKKPKPIKISPLVNVKDPEGEEIPF